MRLRSYIVRDELNGAQALRFADELGRASLRGLEGVELSLRHASGLDVAGMAVLVRLYSQLGASGRSLVISDVPRHIAERFEELGVQHLLAAPAAPRRRFRLPVFARAPRRAYA